MCARRFRWLITLVPITVSLLPEAARGQAPSGVPAILKEWRGDDNEREVIDPAGYPPLPMPEVHDDLQARASFNDDGGDIAEFDARTGEQRIIPRPMIPRAPSWSVVEGSLGSLGDDHAAVEALARFSALAPVNSAASYPWSVNCKVFGKFSGVPFSASGTLIDARFVITAGHCVHWGPGGTWATEVRVAPAYSDGSMPFGYASATNLCSWTGWTVSGDLNHDIAIIRLDRPIGAVTGWVGYGYDTNCSRFTSSLFTQAGYPASSPFDGERMYSWSGTYDGCVGSTQAYHNDRGYHGQSGAAGTLLNGSSRYAYSVVSHGNSAQTVTYDTRLTADKFSFVGSSIAGATPSSVDLQPLYVHGPSQAAAGDSLSNVSFVMFNGSSAAFSGSVTVRVYISTNDVISGSDWLVGSRTVTLNLGAKNRTWVNLSGWIGTIPSAAGAGERYLGVIVDYADANVLNNASSGWDAAEIELSCGNISAPMNIRASDGAYAGRTQITWQPVAGANSYEIWRGVLGNPAFMQRIASGVTASKYNDRSGTACQQYYYRVRAVRACGKTSPYSPFDAGKRGGCH